MSDWMDRIQVGDVLKSASGDYRIVRSADLNQNKRSLYYNRKLYFAFAIRRCSWTGRSTTLLTRHDLINRGYKPVGVRVKLTSEIDKDLEHDLDYNNRFDQVLHCCDVKGVA